VAGTRAHRLALPTILALAAALRCYRPAREGLWLDEAMSVRFARLGLPDILAMPPAREFNPPLYYALLHFWVRLWAEGDAAVRALSIVLGVAAVAAAYRLGRLLLGEEAGLVAALLLATSPYHVYYSQEARFYALLVTLTLVVLETFVRVLRGGGRAAQVTYVIAYVLLFYAHAHAVFVLAVPVLYVLLEYARPAAERPPGLRRWLRLELIVALGAAAWAGPFLARIAAQQTSFWIARPSWPELFRTLSQYAGSTLALAVIGAAVVAEAILGLAAIVRRDARAPRGTPIRPGRLLALWATIPLLAPFLLSQVMTPFFLARASIASLLALHLVAARALGRLPRPPMRWAVVAAVVGASLVNQWRYFQVPSKEQWREAAAWVEARAVPGDLVALDAGYGQPGFDHYARRADVARLALGSDLVMPAGVRELQAALARGADRVFVVRFQRPVDHEAVRRAVGEGWGLRDYRAFVGLQIYLFQRKS
jgi:mannosyltransferase